MRSSPPRFSATMRARCGGAGGGLTCRSRPLAGLRGGPARGAIRHATEHADWRRPSFTYEAHRANDSEQSGGLDAALECFTGRWRCTPPAISTYRRKPAPCRSSACASVPMSAAGGWPSVRWRAPSGRLDVPSAIGCALNKAARISSIVLGTLSNRSPPSPGSRAGSLPDDIKGEEDCSRRERMLVDRECRDRNCAQIIKGTGVTPESLAQDPSRANDTFRPDRNERDRRNRSR